MRLPTDFVGAGHIYIFFLKNAGEPKRMGHNTCKSMGGVLCVVRRYKINRMVEIKYILRPCCIGLMDKADGGEAIFHKKWWAFLIYYGSKLINPINLRRRSSVVLMSGQCCRWRTSTNSYAKVVPLHALTLFCSHAYSSSIITVGENLILRRHIII